MTTPQEFIASALLRERTKAGLTITELARRAGIGKSTLSLLETGSGNPSLETLWALSTALGIPFWRLVEPSLDDVTVIRLGEGNRIEAQDSHYAGTLLSAGTRGVRRDIYRVEAEPGLARRSTPHTAGTIEHVTLIAGRALVGPLNEPLELHPGDYISYLAHVPHLFEALEAHTTAVMVIEHC